MVWVITRATPHKPRIEHPAKVLAALLMVWRVNKMGLLCSDQDRARAGEGSYRTFADKARKTSGGALEIPDKGYFTFAPYQST